MLTNPHTRTPSEENRYDNKKREITKERAQTLRRGASPENRGKSGKTYARGSDKPTHPKPTPTTRHPNILTPLPTPTLTSRCTRSLTPLQYRSPTPCRVSSPFSTPGTPPTTPCHPLLGEGAYVWAARSNYRLKSAAERCDRRLTPSFSRPVSTKFSRVFPLALAVFPGTTAPNWSEKGRLRRWRLAQFDLFPVYNTCKLTYVYVCIVWTVFSVVFSHGLMRLYEYV